MSENKSEDGARFTLAYWKIRGLGGPARLMLAYKNVNYKNVDYENVEPNSGDDHVDWFKVKYTLNLDFPNLPYLIDHKNGLHMTESRAICRYLGRALQIGNHKDPLQAYDEMVGDIVADLGGAFTSICYNPKFLELKGPFFQEKLPTLLQPIEYWLSGDTKFNKHNKSRTWLGGDILCYADFVFWETIDRLLILDKDTLQNFPTIAKYYSNFREIESVKQYLQNDPKARYEINGKSAQFK